MVVHGIEGCFSIVAHVVSFAKGAVQRRASLQGFAGYTAFIAKAMQLAQKTISGFVERRSLKLKKAGLVLDVLAYSRDQKRPITCPRQKQGSVVEILHANRYSSRLLPINSLNDNKTIGALEGNLCDSYKALDCLRDIALRYV